MKERVRLTKTTPRRRTQQQPAITRAPLPPIVPILVKRPSLPGQALPQVFSPNPFLDGYISNKVFIIDALGAKLDFLPLITIHKYHDRVF